MGRGFVARIAGSSAGGMSGPGLHRMDVIAFYGCRLRFTTKARLRDPRLRSLEVFAPALVSFLRLAMM